MGAIYLNGVSYAGGGGQDSQMKVLPTPSAACIDQIYQYVGPTNLNYINGHFYKCVKEDEEYKWEALNVSKDGTRYVVENNILKIISA